MKKKTRQAFWRGWGYVLLPVAGWAWFVGLLGAAPIAFMSTLTMGFFLFQSKVPCGAETRTRDAETSEYQLCRNNAKGLLGGCGQYKAHSWGNAKLIMKRSTWGRFLRSLVRRTSGQAAAIGSLANVGIMMTAIGTLLVAIVK